VVFPLRSGVPEINPVEELIDNPDGKPVADHELIVPVEAGVLEKPTPTFPVKVWPAVITP
jgi:hypothetical protein